MSVECLYSGFGLVVINVASCKVTLHTNISEYK